MTDLEDKAAGGDGPEVVLAPDGPGYYRLEDRQLVEAEELSPEGEFPKYGEFLEVVRLTRTGEPRGPSEYLECTQDLARKLIDLSLGAGDKFTVKSTSKDNRGRWSWVVQREDSPDG